MADKEKRPKRAEISTEELSMLRRGIDLSNVKRRKRFQPPNEAKLVTAPKPPQPIEKGLAGPGLLAQMVVGKFGDHLPGYRLEDILSRHGVEIRRSTIYDWLAAMSDLAVAEFAGCVVVIVGAICPPRIIIRCGELRTARTRADKRECRI